MLKHSLESGKVRGLLGLLSASCSSKLGGFQDNESEDEGKSLFHLRVWRMRGEWPAASQCEQPRPVSAYPAARPCEATAVSASTGCWPTPEITVVLTISSGLSSVRTLNGKESGNGINSPLGQHKLRRRQQRPCSIGWLVAYLPPRPLARRATGGYRRQKPNSQWNGNVEI